MSAHNFVGAFGAALIVGAYVLLQLEKLDPKNLSYSLLNAVGAALVLVSLTLDFNLAAFVVEAFWLVVSGIGIAKSLSRRRDLA